MATVANNSSNDDGGQTSNVGNPNVQAYGNTGTGLASTTDGNTTTNAGTTTQGKAGSSTLRQGRTPTIRSNPLGYLASYTYQITLYMLTPDAFNAFRASGRKNISNLVVKSTTNSGNVTGGAYVILQSGGINNESTTRAPGFELDYYVNDLQITNVVSPAENKAPTVQTTITFNITEPYGFSFLSRLKFASDELLKYSKTLNGIELKDSSRQYFVLGVRFQGVDKYGKVLTGKETVDGRVLDPNGSGNGLFETFYEIVFRKITFKIEGKATTYNVTAVSVNSDTLSIKNNMIPSNVSIEASTVDEALNGPNGLISTLNNFWNEMVETNKVDIGFKYKVEYVGRLEDLKNANLVLPEDTTKWKWPIKTLPNDYLGVKAVPNSTKRLLTFSNTPSMPISSAIERIIANSSFLRNSLKVNYTNELIPDDETDSDAEVKPDVNKIFRWFNITTNTKVIGYSKFLKDWVYEITYVISPYETPIILSPYAKNLPKYYGPVKRYDYWFTGENTEIVSYEQNNNLGYFLVTLDPSLNVTNTNGSANIPQRPNFQTDSDHTSKLGPGSEATGSITSYLYDPQAYARARITILGDPDFLVQDSLNYDVATKKFDQFFATNGTTVNPTGGQIFIEIDFKEGVDYNYKTGTMDINDSIVFWQYSEAVKKLVKGVSYQVTRIVSNFKNGRFTQDLHLNINQFGPEYRPTSADANVRSDQSTAETARLQRQNQLPGTRNATGSVTTASNASTSNNTGFRQDQPVAQSNPPLPSQSSVSPDDPGTVDTGVITAGGRE